MSDSAGRENPGLGVEVDEDIVRRATQIRILILDVDGVLTDGRLHYDGEGRECKSFHVRDGLGIQQVMRAGIYVAVISGRGSIAAQARLTELKIGTVELGRHDKLAVLNELVARLAIPLSEICVVGDDLPDLPLMTVAGLSIAVADAHPSVKRLAHWQTQYPGGRGAVREVCDLLVLAMTRRPA